MSDALDRYRRVADGLSARVNAVAPGDWDNPSPCEAWTARQVMSHVIGNGRAGLDQLDGVEHVSRDHIEDVPGEWAAVRADVEAALADPNRARTEIQGPFGPMAYEDLISQLACMDILIHTWDVAKATGGDPNVDAEIAAQSLEFLTPLDANLRQPGLFDPAVEPPPGADVVTRLMAFVGRKV